MKLYIHCGYHKTGSSFLQTVFAQSRKFLIKNEVYFPVSEGETDMLEAKISPGNGIELVNHLNNSSEIETTQLLEKWIRKAKKNNCSSLLISAEGLFHTFSKKESLKMFCEVCDKLSINNIEALLFFRDPIKHAFSVFKHRGKYGRITRFNDWVENDYETLNLSERFLSYYNDFNINWRFRKYSSNSSLLTEIAFKDWLDIPIPKIIEEKKVNKSLTFSEVLALSETRKFVNDYSLKRIHSSFNQLSKSNKATEVLLNNYYSKIAFDSLTKNVDVIKSINEVLPHEEQLEFKDTDVPTNYNTEQVSLSMSQLSILFEEIRKSNSFGKKIIYILKNTIKRMLRFFRK